MDRLKSNSGITSSSTLTLEVLMSFPPRRGPCGDDPDARVALSARASVSRPNGLRHPFVKGWTPATDVR